jgi:hypothetical protein
LALATQRVGRMSALGLGCVKTKSDLVVMPSEGRIFAFFALSATTSLKILGAVIPGRVFAQPGSMLVKKDLRGGSEQY